MACKVPLISAPAAPGRRPAEFPPSSADAGLWTAPLRYAHNNAGLLSRLAATAAWGGNKAHCALATPDVT